MIVSKSGAEATAIQTLTRLPNVLHFAERLECGAFTAAFSAESVFIRVHLWLNSL